MNMLNILEINHAHLTPLMLQMNILKVPKSKIERHLKDHMVHTPRFVFRKWEIQKFVMSFTQ